MENESSKKKCASRRDPVELVFQEAMAVEVVPLCSCERAETRMDCVIALRFVARPPVELPTCLDHNFSKSTNSALGRLSWKRSRGDLAGGALRKFVFVFPTTSPILGSSM